jgi:hypothetical protein
MKTKKKEFDFEGKSLEEMEGIVKDIKKRVKKSDLGQKILYGMSIASGLVFVGSLCAIIKEMPNFEVVALASSMASIGTLIGGSAAHKKFVNNKAREIVTERKYKEIKRLSKSTNTQKPQKTEKEDVEKEM